MHRHRISSGARRILATLSCAVLLIGGERSSTAEDSGSPPVPQPTPSPTHIAAVMGGVEAAIDAPWRIEPELTQPKYPVIPIVVSIHDASIASDGPPQLGQFCELAIREEANSGPVPPPVYRTAATLDEVERSGKWPNFDEFAGNHRLCRPATGQQCAADLVVGSSAEWHATVFYTPRTQSQGADVRLTVQVRVAREGQPCGAPFPIVEDAPFDRLGLVNADQQTSYFLTNRLSVHLGEAPLPGFGTSYVYGDLHYHSQGTDNEGESAHAYRQTLQAMRAMGLDFLFATDHASASQSGQTTDIDEIFVNVPDDLPYVPGFLDEFVSEWLQGKADGVAVGAVTSAETARDMNDKRFQAMRAVLNEPPGTTNIAGFTYPSGANADVMKFPGRKGAARIFLGGEVDVIPEFSPSEKYSGSIVHGNGRLYNWQSACTLMPAIHQKAKEMLQRGGIEEGEWICDDPRRLAEEAPEGGRYLLRDLQGITDDLSYMARQHLLHLPVDPTRTDAFVASNTSLFGGGHRRLKNVLREDYDVAQKGFAFLAHPVEGESGNGLSRLGPDIAPYSDVQLRTAFESKYLLGLQLWNGDERMQSWAAPGGPQGFPLQPYDAGPSFTRWLQRRWLGPAPRGPYQQLHDGLAAWDKMNLWGIRSSQTAGLGLEGKPRRVFMAGGSDAHGDLNYRRQGAVGLSAVTDTAIGKPRNLVHVGLERAETVTGADGASYGVASQGQVTSALAEGNFSVTDGPALRIAVDLDSNGFINPDDVPMGGVAEGSYRGKYVPVVVEWKSTAEFGPVASIDLYVGVANDAKDAGLVYAATGHGIHSVSTASGAVSSNAYVDAQGVSHYELKDGYMFDPTSAPPTQPYSGKLRIVLTPQEGIVGRKTVFLRANDFVVGRRRVHTDEPVCHWTVDCNKPGFPDQCEEVCTEPESTYHFDNVVLPDRMFVRAMARTSPPESALCADTSSEKDEAERIAQNSGRCIERLAFTNPVWVDNSPVASPGYFRVGCAPQSLTIPNGGSANLTCSVTSIDGFDDPVNLGCVGAPSGVTCTFTPASLTPPANGSISSTLTISAAGAAIGSGTVRVRGFSSAPNFSEVTLNVGVVAPTPTAAAYDPSLLAPSCGSRAVAACETGTLVFGRSTGGREPNTPNTLGASCADGASAPVSGRWNAVDAIKVSSAAGTPLSAGTTARIDATVWVSVPGEDTVDFYYAADALNPGWTLIGTQVPRAAGAQTVSASYSLPAGALQAIRVQLRRGRDASPCAPDDLNDRDDLVFGVAGSPR